MHGSTRLKWPSIFSCYLLLAACGSDSSDHQDSMVNDTEASTLTSFTLESVHEYWQSLPANSLVIMEDGKVVVQWGDVENRVKLSSVRKSLLSAMYGPSVHDGAIDIHATLDEIGIDDSPDSLTSTEQTATVQMLLQARSGIFHSYIGGTPTMLARQPKRNSHAPGTFWYYNNWDFNALGTIFEEAVGQGIGEAFETLIAQPIGMQDFRAGDVYYIDDDSSIHRQYHFRMSARDLALFGELMRRDGQWNDVSIIPAEWVAESTKSYSAARNGRGYGYLWWTAGESPLFEGVSLPEGSFAGFGAAGKYLVVIPNLGLVVSHVQQREWPDNAMQLPKSDLPGPGQVTNSAQMGELLSLIIAAKPHNR